MDLLSVAHRPPPWSLGAEPTLCREPSRRPAGTLPAPPPLGAAVSPSCSISTDQHNTPPFLAAGQQ